MIVWHDEEITAEKCTDTAPAVCLIDSWHFKIRFDIIGVVRERPGLPVRWKAGCQSHAGPNQDLGLRLEARV